jgi:regulatory protein
MASGDTDAYGLALRALGRKERTEAQLAQWLRERGVEENELAEVMSRLIEAELLDDERFATQYAADKRDLQGWGPDRIRGALRERGVEEGLIDRAIADDGPEQVTARAVEVLERSGATADSDAARNRSLGLLARRGYPLEVAYDAIRTLERNG